MCTCVAIWFAEHAYGALGTIRLILMIDAISFTVGVFDLGGDEDSAGLVLNRTAMTRYPSKIDHLLIEGVHGWRCSFVSRCEEEKTERKSEEVR